MRKILGPIVLAFVVPGPLAAHAQGADRGREAFEQICATCHGVDGKGGPGTQNLQMPMPDFTDCAFASREPDRDWLAVANDGGPARGFSPVMPPHAQSLGPETLELVIAHIRKFCTDTRWPRGELNLPRPQLTEKAFPEDEAVLEVAANLDQETSATTQIVYEKRIGARGQWELTVPFEVQEDASGSTLAGLGDVAIGAKYALWHDLERGGIVSVLGEAILPSGDRDRDLGSGTLVLEPALLWGQLLPWEGFLQAQLLGEIPMQERRKDPEMQLRAALGKSFFQGGPFGREWAPMVEFVGTRVFVQGAPDEWEFDLAPQLHVSLNRRQNIRLSLGARVPVGENAHDRPTRALFYFLWDWYDGGLTEGW